MIHNARTLLLLIVTLVAGTTHAATAEPAAAAATPAPPLTDLQPFHANYEVSLNNLPFKATATQSLVSLGGNRWRLELKLESFLIDTTEYSEFRWDGANCRTVPERYGYTRAGIGKDRQLTLAFDHARHVVTRNDGKTTTTFEAPDATEDKLGHSLALACRLARGVRGTLGVVVAWDKDVRRLDYQVNGQERVNTKLGTFDTVRVARKRTDSDRITTTWFAPSAGWQAVQMQHTEGDGRLFQLRLLDMVHAR